MTETLGVTVTGGCQIIHGVGAQLKTPFEDVNLTMHNMSISNTKGFRGQLGWMEFQGHVRLPRHIHMDLQQEKLLDERILVLNGTGLVELAGAYYVVAPGSMVVIRGGVPHTWTVCPPGLKLPDGSISEGRFFMVYEYEDETTFFPTASTKVISQTQEYERYQDDFEAIRFPHLDARTVVAEAMVVINRRLQTLSRP